MKEGDRFIVGGKHARGFGCLEIVGSIAQYSCLSRSIDAVCVYVKYADNPGKSKAKLELGHEDSHWMVHKEDLCPIETNNMAYAWLLKPL